MPPTTPASALRFNTHEQHSDSLADASDHIAKNPMFWPMKPISLAHVSDPGG